MKKAFRHEVENISIEEIIAIPSSTYFTINWIVLSSSSHFFTLIDNI